MRWPWSGRDADLRALDEEIRAHLAMAVTDRVARGESPDQALAAARREFGNVGLVKEVTRELWGRMWLERLAMDVGYAVRSLRRAPAFSVVAIVTLALGIGVNTAMFTVVRGILLRPLPFQDPDALYALSHSPARIQRLVGPSMVDDDYVAYRRATTAFALMASYNTYPATLLGAGDPVRLPTASVTPNFFGTLGVTPALGRVFRAGDDASGASNIAVIAYGLWRDRFGGDTTVIGRSVSIEGYRKTIIGVMPEGFDFPQHTALWVPVAIAPEGHNHRFRPVIGRLAPNVSLPAARAELRVFAENRDRATDHPDAEPSITTVVPLRDVVVGNVRTPLLIFSGAVALVLFIACANVSNLMLMRAASRAHELGIRAALGATRMRLIRQLLTESLIVALAGGIVGLGVSYAGVALLLAVAPADLLPRTRDIHVDASVLAMTVGMCLLAGIIAGTAPALGGSRRDLRAALGDAVRTTSRSGLRALFVTAEAALALMLLIGAGLLLRSFERLRSVDLGFVPGHIVTATVDLPDTRYHTAALLHDVQQRISARIAAVPGVHASAVVNWLPLTRTTIAGDFTLEDRRPLPPGYMVLKPCVTPDYFAVMGIRIREGRGFLQSDGPSSARVVIVTRSVAERLWPGESPLGRRLTMEDRPRPSDWMTIVGVVDDIVQEGLAEPRAQAIYQDLAQVDKPFFINHLNFVARADGTGDARVVGGMRAAIRAVDPDQPIESILTMEARLSAVVAEPRFWSLLFTVFSALALSLAAIGIYGVLAYAVAERTRELGIRIALGATPREVVALVLANSGRLAIPGLVIGITAGLAAARLLSSLLFEVGSADPLTFVAASMVLLAVALVAGYLPARRASRIDPVVTIK